MEQRGQRRPSNGGTEDFGLTESDLFFSSHFGGDASSSSDQSSPSNQDALSPGPSSSSGRSANAAGSSFGDAPNDPNSLFFDGASALSSFLNFGPNGLSGMGSGAANGTTGGAGMGGMGGGAVDGPWPAMSMAGFSVAGSPAVLHAASPQGFGPAFGGSERPAHSDTTVPSQPVSFWADSPGIPSPMGMDATATAEGIMHGLDQAGPAPTAASHGHRPSGEFDFGALVAEDKCGCVVSPPS